MKNLYFLFTVVIFTVFAAIPSARAELDISAAVRHPGINASKSSISIADAENGKVLASYQPELTLNPASCAKVITSAAALSLLGPSYRLKTNFYSDARPQGGAISTLYVAGTGDPTLVNEELAGIARDLSEMGIRRVTGGIVIDNSYFDSYEYPRKDTGEGRAYTAKTSATSVNFNSIGIEIGPGEGAGKPGYVTTDPPSDYFKIVNKVVTGGKFRSNILIKRLDDDHESITVTGRVPARFAPQKFYRSVIDPALYAGAMISYWLEQNGIKVEGPIRGGVVPRSAALLAAWQSKPLSQIVADMNKASNNFIAEQLLKHLGAAKLDAPGSTAKGIAAVSSYLSSIGIPKGSYEMENGSGLSEITRVSAAQLVRVLGATYKDKELRGPMMQSLSVLGVDGTTKKWRVGTGLEGIVLVKTGTINGVSTLAGFAPAANGRTAAFAILLNGLPRGVPAAHQAELNIVKAITGGR